MKTTFRCFIRTLSPVHIGCDEVYEPTGFVVNTRTNQIVAFDPLSFLSQMSSSDKQKFSQLCAKGTLSSILEIYKFLKNRTATGRTVDICRGFIAHYNQTVALSATNEKKIQQELNRFTIRRTSFLSYDQRPYIPGSSVKGSLRTAYLNSLAQIEKVPKQRGEYAAADLEKKLLGGSFETDPFRLVKVSDFMPVDEIRTRIVYAVNEKKKPSRFEARGPYRIVEVIQPGAVFSGEITVEQPEAGAGIESPVLLDRLLNSTSFYTKEKNREDEELKQIGISPASLSVNTGGYLIRIGQYSGAESLTVEGHRSIKIMKAKGEKPEYLDHTTTFWLASEEAKPNDKLRLMPFGWSALLRELPKDETSKYETSGQTGIQELTPVKQKAKAPESLGKSQSPVDFSGLRDKFSVREKGDRKKK
jgi:CRISPR-associated protein Csm5